MSESPAEYIQRNLTLWANGKRKKYLTMQELLDRYVIVEIHDVRQFEKYYDRFNEIIGMDNWYIMSRTLVLNSMEDLTVFVLEFSSKTRYRIITKNERERFFGDY